MGNSCVRCWMAVTVPLLHWFTVVRTAQEYLVSGSNTCQNYRCYNVEVFAIGINFGLKCENDGCGSSEFFITQGSTLSADWDCRNRDSCRASEINVDDSNLAQNDGRFIQCVSPLPGTNRCCHDLTVNLHGSSHLQIRCGKDDCHRLTVNVWDDSSIYIEVAGITGAPLTGDPVRIFVHDSGQWSTNADRVQVITEAPTVNPTLSPSLPTTSPSGIPTTLPTATKNPSLSPTSATVSPSPNPTPLTVWPTEYPSHSPTLSSVSPTGVPTSESDYPTMRPSFSPTIPTMSPSLFPTVTETTENARDSRNNDLSMSMPVWIAIWSGCGLISLFLVYCVCKSALNRSRGPPSMVYENKHPMPTIVDEPPPRMSVVADEEVESDDMEGPPGTEEVSDEPMGDSQVIVPFPEAEMGERGGTLALPNQPSVDPGAMEAEEITPGADAPSVYPSGHESTMSNTSMSSVSPGGLPISPPKRAAKSKSDELVPPDQYSDQVEGSPLVVPAKPAIGPTRTLSIDSNDERASSMDGFRQLSRMKSASIDVLFNDGPGTTPGE